MGTGTWEGEEGGEGVRTVNDELVRVMAQEPFQQPYLKDYYWGGRRRVNINMYASPGGWWDWGGGLPLQLTCTRSWLLNL